MDEIRKALVAADTAMRQAFLLGDWSILIEANKKSSEALALLPPEGETREEHNKLAVAIALYLRLEKEEHNSVGDADADAQAARWLHEHDKRLLTKNALPTTAKEPAPSSEKALREALISIADWSIDVGYPDDKYRMKQIALRALGLPENTRSARQALASSPAPKTFDEAIAQAGGTGIAEFERKAPVPLEVKHGPYKTADELIDALNAPEAPKEKREIKDLSDTVQFNDGMDD